MILKRVRAKKIKDSRGEPTIEVSVNWRKSSAPAGKSKGAYETSPYMNSLDWNIKSINTTDFSELDVNSFDDLKLIENFIKNKLNLKDAKQFGANSLFALECATLKALAYESKKQLWEIINPKAKNLPVPVGNAVGGGVHSNNESRPTIQEFLIIPQKETIKENYKIMRDTHKEIKKILNAKSQNDEGAWETSREAEEILEILDDKFSDIKIGMDVAASSFYKERKYCYKNQILTEKFQIIYINSLIKRFDLFYVEDPLEEKDFEGFSKIYRSPNHLVVGDDLTATQIDRLKKAISKKSINAMIIKPNQNGSLLELKEIFEICRRNNIKTILSHRSGETLDSALADLAFGFQADFIKCGIATKWREVKLKRLCEIERSLKKRRA